MRAGEEVDTAIVIDDDDNNSVEDVTEQQRSQSQTSPHEEENLNWPSVLNAFRLDRRKLESVSCDQVVFLERNDIHIVYPGRRNSTRYSTFRLNLR